ncbi:MAG: cytochrome c-type biogenesis protein CcmH [Vicinamibacterales bacterium]|nr:cytochrome c-type biogenesis protein CcmH [Vicinamibacterales bacterium]
MRTVIALVVAGALAVLLGFALREPAPPPDPGSEAQAIAGAIMSPFCPGLVLTACPSENARELRTEIRERLEAGEARSAIEADLVARFGQGVLADPSSLPGGRIAVLVPAALGLAGLVAIAAFLRRSTRRGGDTETPHDPPPDDALADQLDDELARLG